MEDQKLLWIVFSVVLFVVVVLASVLYFLKPKTNEPALAATPATLGSAFDTYEYVRGASPTLPIQTDTSEDSGLEIVVGEEPAESVSAIPEPVRESSRVLPRAEEPASESSKPAAVRAPAAQAPREAAPREAAPREAAPKPATRAASQPGRIYWIQTASFKSRTSAESMVESLGKKGITGRIQVSDVGGQAYFRVRVGPYTSRDEAEKFLAWIKGVRGLEQSYVSAVTRPAE